MSKHYINMHSSVSSYSNTNSFSIYNQNISPLFGYSNTYRNMTSNTFSSNFTTTKIIQGGEVSTFDESIILSLTLDVNNVISKVYHERIFSELNYGQPFRFINY